MKYLESVFGMYREHDDPLMAYLQVAVQKDLDPVDAIHYWISTNGKNAWYFKVGIRGQKQLLTLLTSNKEYFDKHAKTFLEYLAYLAGTV